MAGTTPNLGLVTLVDADNARVALNTHWNTNATILDGAAGRSPDNLLTNPGMEIWSRGAGGFSANLAYTADRWQLSVAAPSSASVTRAAAEADAGSQYALSLAYTHGAGGAAALGQKLEAWPQLRGRTVTFAVRVWAPAAGRVRARVYDGLAITDGAYNVSSAYETLTLTRDVPANATTFEVYVRADAASGTVYLDNAVLSVGGSAPAYVPPHPQDALLRCQRYYEVQGGVASTIYFKAYAPSATDLTIARQVVAKAATPSVTKNGTWSVFNCAQPVVGAPSTNGFYIGATASATGLMSFGTDTPDDTITIESNP